jgi:hypothetical protein
MKRIYMPAWMTDNDKEQLLEILNNRFKAGSNIAADDILRRLGARGNGQWTSKGFLGGLWSVGQKAGADRHTSSLVRSSSYPGAAHQLREFVV